MMFEPRWDPDRIDEEGRRAIHVVAIFVLAWVLVRVLSEFA